MTDDTMMGGSALLEMNGFLSYVTTTGAGENPEVAAFVTAHQLFQIVAGNQSRWPNMAAFKTAMSFAGPAVSSSKK